MSQQPPDPTRRPLARPWPPDFMFELWVREQLRDRLRRNNAALAHDHQEPLRSRHVRTAEPQTYLEAEP